MTDTRLTEAIEGLRESVDRLAKAQEALAANLSSFVGLADELLVASDLGKDTSCED